MHRSKCVSSLVVTSLLAAAAAMPALAEDQEPQDWRRAYEELRRMYEEQQRAIDEMRAERASSQGQGATIRELADQLAAPEGDELVRWKQISRQGSKWNLYGFLRLDMVYDDSRPNNTELPGWIRSEDESAPGGTGSFRNREDFTVHPRLTRLGLDFEGPVVESLNDAKVTGKIEVDFYGLPSSESRAGLRMRHAYLKLSWCDGLASLLAGQTQDLISPLNPAVNNDLVMWGAGNLGDRRPQVRFDFAPAFGDSKLLLAGMIGQTGAIDAQDLDPAGTYGAGFRDGETSGRPTLQARIGYQTPNWDGKAAEFGIWGHQAWEDADVPVTMERHYRSQAFGIDVNLPLWEDKVWVRGEAWRGYNLDDVRGGIFQGVTTAFPISDEVGAKGGWVELGFRPVKWYAVIGGFAMDNPVDGDLLSGGRSKNEVWYLANRFYLDPIELGLEYLHWTTEFIGFQDGVDNRLLAYISYKF